MKIAIIGTGVSGLVAARELAGERTLYDLADAQILLAKPLNRSRGPRGCRE